MSKMIPNLSPEEFRVAVGRTNIAYWLPRLPYSSGIWPTKENPLKYMVFENHWLYPTTILFYKPPIDFDTHGEGICLPKIYIDSIKKAIKELAGFYPELRYPIFIRGSHGSSKFNWCKTCYVENEERLEHNLYYLINDQIYMHEQPFKALVVREYIEPYKIFDVKPLQGCIFPLALEVRLKVFCGTIVGWTRYWPKDAVIRNWARHKDLKPDILPDDWEEIYDQEYIITKADMDILKTHVWQLRHLPGSWSIDFMKSRNGEWFLIDMADARLSWWPEKLHSPKEVIG